MTRKIFTGLLNNDFIKFNLEHIVFLLLLIAFSSL